MFRYLLIILLVFGFCSAGASQVDSLEAEIPSEETAIHKLKPMVGLGIGTFTFYGDTGKGMKSNSPFTSSLALSANAQMPLNSFLDLSFSAVFSNVKVNEPGERLLNNFKSEISGGTILLTYNFDNFLPKEAYWQPYIGTGISSFEFLSKADLHDAEGNKYHLWEDGSIMSISETAANASEAIMLERDYVYETDLRGLNRESNGFYRDNTLSIPVSAGLNFKLSKHLKGNLGTTLFFNFNDLADDVQNDETKSDGKKDKFLHTSLGISYDLHVPSKNKPSFDIDFENEEELLAYEYWDSDKDGVPDLDDDCLGHPEGIEVDKNGCPLDGDEDGVADYKDDEPLTEKGALVDEFGVTIEDDIFLEKYIVWIDSLNSNSFDELYSRVEGEKSPETFSVLVLPDKRGMNQTEINSLLAEENVRATSENGQEGFLVGEFETLPEAVNKKLELEEQGLNGTVQKELEGVRTDIDNEIGAMSEVIEERNKRDGPSTKNTEILYRVQVGAFRYDLSDDIFSGIDDLLVLSGNDGLTRYMTNSYADSKSAAERRVLLLTEGFEDAFITAYQNGQRITLSNAGMKTTGVAPDLTYDEENNSIKPEFIKFQIQLGEYQSDIPTSSLEAFLELGKVKPMKDGSLTRYMFGSFNSLTEAKEVLSTLKAKGIQSAEIKGMFNGSIINLEEALHILGEKDQSYSGE